MQYPFECESESCRRRFVVRAPMNKAPQRAKCPLCGSGRTQRIYGGFQIVSKGEKPFDKVLDGKKAGLSIARDSGITMAQQRDLYKKEIRAKRQAAKEAERFRRSGRRKHGELRLVGSVPVELFRCAQRTAGDRMYWSDDPKKALKEHDLYFGDD